MTPRNQFTDEEWEAVTATPVIAAALISAVDYSELSEESEVAAFAAVFTRLGPKYGDVPLIQAVLDATAGDSVERFKELCHALSASSQSGGDSPIEQRLRQIGDAVRLVDGTLSDGDSKAYKQFVHEIAVVVARAHREGTLPFSNPISRQEDFYLRRLREALGI